VAEPPNLAVLLTHCGQLILGKISKFDASKCQLSRLKCTEFDFCWDYAPDPAGGAYTYSTPPDLMAVWLISLTSKGGSVAEWLVYVLDSGAEGPGFKSQSRRCRVTVLGKLFTPIV